MKKIVMIALSALILMPMMAQEVSKESKKEAVKSHLKQHFKPYGFIRNYFAFDSRESMSGTGDLYNYQPKDENWNKTDDPELRQDLNAISTFRFLTLTTRVGLNIVGYKWRNWDSLRMNNKDYARVELLMGQAWHPMAADLCDAIALNSGAPFGPFSRTPQVKMDARLGNLFTLTGALIWQMQYCSIGPDGQSAEYIGYSKTPEAYLGLTFHHKGWLVRAGADVLSIKPRHIGKVIPTPGDTVAVKVSDRLTTISPFVYLQYKKGEFSIKAKSIFAESGEHMNMNGGYGVSDVKSDGSWAYTPTRTSSSSVREARYSCVSATAIPDPSSSAAAV